MAFLYKKRVHYLFSIYVPLKVLLRCVWYFDFACFRMTVVKNLMKKYPFMTYFQNVYAVLVLYNFFVLETLSRKMMVLLENSVSVLLVFFKPE